MGIAALIVRLDTEAARRRACYPLGDFEAFLRDLDRQIVAALGIPPHLFSLSTPTKKSD